jgi:hypothetical protein
MSRISLRISTDIFNLISLTWKSKGKLMRSPCCLSVSVHLPIYLPLIFRLMRLMRSPCCLSGCVSLLIFCFLSCMSLIKKAYEITLLSVCLRVPLIFRLIRSSCCPCVYCVSLCVLPNFWGLWDLLAVCVSVYHLSNFFVFHQRNMLLVLPRTSYIVSLFMDLEPNFKFLSNNPSSHWCMV